MLPPAWRVGILGRRAMPVICFVSYEIHPTTMGGCGVLIHHQAERLLRAGHEVVLLLDMPEPDFRRFLERDRASLPRHESCHAYRVDDLCDGFPYADEDVPCLFQRKSLRFAFALDRLCQRETPDFIEFFEYCGAAYYAMVRRLLRGPAGGPVIGVRLHGSLEILYRFGGGGWVDRDQAFLYGLEHRALELAETILTPSRTYFDRYYRPLYGLDDESAVVSPPPRQLFPAVTRRPLPSGPFAVVFLGRLSALKGVEQLVHAAVALMKRRPELDFTVDLIGYDADRLPSGQTYGEFVRSLIPDALRGRFVFTGQLSHEDVAARLERTLFAVFPNRVESFCYALHEIYDAGVPVIVNDLPSFADFFRSEDNALVYDGTTEGLLQAMERMIDDTALRERLCRPYPVAETSTDGFYAAPRALRPIAPDACASAIRPVVVVLEDTGAAAATLASLDRQTTQDFSVVRLLPKAPDRHETFWWLGRAWYARDRAGNPIPPSDLVTTDALVVLRAGDELDDEWLERATRVLACRSRLAFAGSWLRANGRVVPVALDIAPELYPFEQGTEPGRVLIRTERGHLLADLFDGDIGPFGEVAYLWQAIARWGGGVLAPEPLVGVTDGSAPVDLELLKRLVFRYGGYLGARMPLLAAMLVDELRIARPRLAAARRVLAPPTADAWREHAEDVADRLGGRVLARMALRRLARLLRGRNSDATLP